MKKYIIFIFISCKEQFEFEYQSYDAVLKDNMMIKGWIPNILPKTSKNISFINNIDNNEVVGKFYLYEPFEKSEVKTIDSSIIWHEYNKLCIKKESIVCNNDIYRENNKYYSYQHFYLIEDSLHNVIYFFSIGDKY